MTDDVIYMVTMPTLRAYADRCRQLALTARSPAMQKQLLKLAADMERQAGRNERQEAAATDRDAG
jgi:hypothetical protein